MASESQSSTSSHGLHHSFSAKSSNLQSSKNYVLGLLLLGIVLFLWTLSNFITQNLLHSGFQKPFLVTYLNTSSFVLYLVPYLWRVSTHSKPHNVYKNRRMAASEQARLLSDPDLEPEDVLCVTESSNHSLTIDQTSNLALIFCFIWFLANWILNASLGYTTVASATILSSTSGFFTLLIGWSFTVEILTPTKMFAVILSILGVILVSMSDSSSSKSLLTPSLPRVNNMSIVFGDFLALMSSFFYAMYTILLKVRIGNESRIDMQLFFGFVGLYNISFCWIFGVILHVFGMEIFELPVTYPEIIAILINMIVTFTSDYLYVLSMLKTTPLVVTIGLSLTIPLAVIGDIFLGTVIRLQVLFGAFLILVSFLLVGVTSNESAMRSESDSRL